jgi:hypothetical protein
MSYMHRTGGPRHYRHDPADQGIFIHGGTCLMHGPQDSFKHDANPNYFTITWPILNGEHPFQHALPYPAARTFQQALDLTKRIRDEHPEIHHCPIYACTDLIKDKPWSGRYQIQLASPRLTRRKAAVQPALKAA